MKKTLSFALMALFCICGYAQTIDPVLLLEMERRTDAEKIKVIVIMKSQYDRQQLGRNAAHYTMRAERREFVVNELRQFAETSQYELRSTLSEMESHDMTTAPKIIYMANALYFSATKQAINDLAMRRDIELIGLDEKKHVLFDEEPRPASNIRGITSNVLQVNADQVWDLGYTGQGVVVAVIDTGVNYNHLDLADHLWDGGSEYPYHGYNFAYGTLDPMDDHGHGTHCAGTVCGDGTAGKQTGMAPDATLMCIKVLDAYGFGEASVTCNAMQWAVEQGCDLFSMSLGWSDATLTERMLFRNTCAAILDAGVMGAISAGNNGHVQYWFPIPYNVDMPGGCPPPYMDSIQETNSGGLSCALCVGAVGADDNAAYFTSRGPVAWTDTEFGDYPYTFGSITKFGLIRPDVCAPGIKIISTDSWDNASYSPMSGTSMAAPCVAGCISLMLSKNIDATPAEICQILEETAVSPVEGKSNIYGFGRVDVLAAINALNVRRLTLESFTVNDVQGNNNGNLNAGETVALDLTLRNDSNNALDGVTMVLSTESEYVTITNGTTTLPNFEAGQTQTIENIFAFTLSDDVPGNSEIQFAAEIFVDGEPVGIINFSVMVYGYALKFDEVIVLNDDNGDGVLDAGETADLRVVISNMGEEPATSIVGALSTAFPQLIINDTLGTFGDIGVDGQAFADFSVTLSSDAPEAYVLDLSLDLVNDNEMHSNLDFELLKGIIVFADANVETICVSYCDTNGDGRLSYEEAASITYLSSDFENNSEITSFDELQYFTGLAYIQNNAFENCSSLTSVVLPNSISWVGQSAFSHCTGLNTLTLGNSVASIGDSSFFQCRNLFVITSFAEVPPSLGDNAFDSLGSNTIVCVRCGFEDAYASLPWGGFSNFYGMYGGTVTVVANPEEYGSVIGGGTFEAGQTCTVTATPIEGYEVNWFLNGIVVSYNAEYTFYVTGDMTLVAHFVPEGNMVFADSNTKDICVSQWDADGDGELSYGEAARVRSIGVMFSDHTEITSFEELRYFVNLSSISPRAFYGCSGLTGSLTIPDSVVSIGSEAFYNCISLDTLIIGNSVTAIDSNAFNFCSGLTSITIGNSVTSIGINAFHACSSLTTMDLPNSVATIDSAAFSFCNSLDSIVLPNSVATIGASAFEGCDSLNVVYYTGDIHQWCHIQFGDSYSNPLYYAHNLFIDDGLVTDLVIPETVTEIKPFAFYGASCLTSLTLPDALTLIDSAAFYHCTYLESMTVLAETPPALYHYVFASDPTSISVYVPCGSLEAYQDAEGWNEFMNFIEMCPGTITVTAYPAENGSVTGGGTFEGGETCIVTAVPNEGYFFECWKENNQIVSTEVSYSFVVTGDRNLTANFYTPQPGMLNGQFSVVENQLVCFSQGNLQYQASTNTWQFAEHQWDFVGEGNNNISSTYDGWIDLFGWGTSGNNHGAVCYQPWSTSDYYGDYYVYDNWQTNLFDQAGQADWGVNTISNGGNQTNQWRTLNTWEWEYVFNTRITPSGIRYAKAKVNDVNGVILLPDSWDASLFVLSETNQGEASYNSNIITASDWLTVFEPSGAVFLPAAGYRSETSANNVGFSGDYWSDTYNGSELAYCMYLDDSNLFTGTSRAGYRSTGHAVRVVRPASAATSYTIEVVPNSAPGGTVSGAGTYNYYDQVTLTASANEGYTFYQWKENGNVISTNNSISFVVLFDRSLEACFLESSIYPLLYSFNEDDHTATVTGHWEGVELTGEFVIPETVMHNGESYTVTSVGEYALSDCSGLTSIVFSNSLVSIGNWAFRYCHGLTEVVIPSSVTSIGVNPFANCSNLAQITVESGNYYYDSRDNCNAIIETGTNTLVSGSQNTIIPNTVTHIGQDAFNEILVSSITFPASVNYIGIGAIMNIPTLSTITVLAENPPTLDECTFCEVNKSIPVYVPCGFREAYQNAEGWNEFTNIQGYIYELTVVSSDENMGTVTILQEPDCEHDAIVQATPIGDYVFFKWTENGEIVSTEATYTFPLEEDRTLTAHFGTLTNHWTVSENYQNSMFMIGVVQIDGVEQASPTLELGAFCNGECRGSELPFEDGGQWLYFMTIGGNAGDEITFRLYDHVLQQELNLYCFNVIPFEAYALIGMDENYEVIFGSKQTVSANVNPENTGTVTGAGEYAFGANATLVATAKTGYAFKNWTLDGEIVSTEPSYTFVVTESVNLTANFEVVITPQQLIAGWNWWSANHEITLDDLKAALVEAMPNTAIVIRSRAMVTRYVIRTHSWIGPLDWDITQMYKIEVPDDCEITLEGVPVNPADHPVTIVNGPNWIGYPLLESKTLAEALAGFEAVTGDVIKSKSGSARYRNGTWRPNGLNTLEPGQGYIYNSAATGERTLVFPSGAK